METLTYIAPWVLGSVCAGVVAGYFLGRGRGNGQEGELGSAERQAMLKVLVDVLNSAERMNDDVQTHNTEIQESSQQVGSL